VYHERQGFQERFAVDDPRGNPIAKEVLRIVDEADR